MSLTTLVIGSCRQLQHVFPPDSRDTSFQESPELWVPTLQNNCKSGVRGGDGRGECGGRKEGRSRGWGDRERGAAQGVGGADVEAPPRRGGPVEGGRGEEEQKARRSRIDEGLQKKPLGSLWAPPGEPQAPLEASGGPPRPLRSAGKWRDFVCRTMGTVPNAGCQEAPGRENARRENPAKRRVPGSVAVLYFVCQTEKSATVPLGTEWACPQVLCLTP